MTLAFILQTEMNQIFQMQYFMLLQIKGLQKYQRSKLEVEKKIADSARFETDAPGARLI